MRIGIFSDIHGNFIALLHCLKLLEEQCVDKLYFLGDAVGYMPDAKAVLATLLEKRVQCIKGNHEAMLLGLLSCQQEAESVYKLKEAYKTMDAALLGYIENWPLVIESKIGDRKVLFLHGGLMNPLLQYVYPDSSFDDFVKTEYDVVFMGHTHHPFQRQIADKLIVNVGSCGLPRDQGNLLSFAIYDSITNKCRIMRSYLDIGVVLNRYTDLHEKVQACLRRNTTRQVVGEFLNIREADWHGAG